MGGGASCPLEDWTADEVATAVEQFGPTYGETAKTIRLNGVDGGTLAEEESLTDILQEVNVNLLQKKRLAREFKRLKIDKRKASESAEASRQREVYKLRLRNFVRAARNERPWSCSPEGVQEWIGASVIGQAPVESKPELERLAAALCGASGVDLLTVCAEDTDQPPFCKLRRDARGESLLRTRFFKITTIRVFEQALHARGFSYFFALWRAADAQSMLLDLAWERQLGSGSYGEVHCVRNRHTKQVRALKLIRVNEEDGSSRSMGSAQSSGDDSIIADDERRVRICAAEQLLLNGSPPAPTARRDRLLRRSSSDRRIEAACAAIDSATAEMSVQQRAAAASKFVVGIDAWGSFGGHGCPYFLYSIIELCAGTLAVEIQSRKLDDCRRTRLCTQLLLAVRDLHGADLIHLDIKPQNILLTDEDDVRLADLGLATALDANRTMLRSRIGGTRMYSAPEVQTGHYSNKADIYSLGLVFYEMVAGALPNLTSEDVVGPMRGRCDGQFVDIVASMLHLQPRNRPNAADILAKMGSVDNFTELLHVHFPHQSSPLVNSKAEFHPATTTSMAGESNKPAQNV